jgi:hypothetical protein
MVRSHQRRFGQEALVYRTRRYIDSRGNEVEAVDLTSDPLKVKAAFIPSRSARAEVPGQQQINVMRMLVDTNITDVDLWSRIRWNGSWWDIVSPPALHYGTRHVRHISMDIRQRPS